MSYTVCQNRLCSATFCTHIDCRLKVCAQDMGCCFNPDIRIIFYTDGRGFYNECYSYDVHCDANTRESEVENVT